jgi:CBS domain-containing protein
MSAADQLREIEPFNKLPAAQFAELCKAATLASFPTDTYIFRQNDPPTGFLYVVKEGLVAITVLSPDGTDIVVDYRRAGQVFGGTPIFTGEPYSGAVRTVKATVCHLLPAAALQRLQREVPELAGHFSRMYLSRVRSLYAKIVTEQLRANPALMEAYPFKKRLSEIMVTSIETCTPQESAQQVARRLVTRGVGSIPVVDDHRRLLGIITEKELVARVVAPEGVDGQAISAAEIMTPAPPTLSPDTYMYEAMAYMSRHQLRYLPITDGGEVVGMVSLQDLMRYRSHKAMLLIGNIRDVREIDALAAIRQELLTVAHSLLSETRSTPEVMEILSYIHHGIMRRAFEICLSERIKAGNAPPEVRYCFLILGSGGRREMLLGPDQDHALVYEDLPQARLAEVEAFFAPLARDVVQALQRIGYASCDGQVMADNPQWRGRLSDWRERIRGWVDNAEPRQVRSSSIFFDFAPLAGDGTLLAALRDIVRSEVVDQPSFLYQMMALDLRYKVPLGLLGRFILERGGEHDGTLSVKLGGTLYIVDCVRIFALDKGVQETGTLDRLKALVASNIFTPETAEHIRAAFEALTFLRLRQEIDQLEAGHPPSHYLDPGALSKTEQDLLREAFQAVSKLQDATKRYFSRTPF